MVFGRTRDHNVFPGPVTGIRGGLIPKAWGSISTIWRIMVVPLNLAPEIFSICFGRGSGIWIGLSSSTGAHAKNTSPLWLPAMTTTMQGTRTTRHRTVCRWDRTQTPVFYGQLYLLVTQIRVSVEACMGVVSEDRVRMLEFHFAL